MAIEDVVTPFPTLEITPPDTKINFVCNFLALRGLT
jgi:hypothetical protein